MIGELEPGMQRPEVERPPEPPKRTRERRATVLIKGVMPSDYWAFAALARELGLEIVKV